MMIFTKIIDFLFPHICIFCSAVGDPVCKNCLETSFIRYPDEDFKNNETAHLDRIFINYAYNDSASKLIYDFKYNDCFSYKDFISDLILKNSSQIIDSADYITCVPMHRKKLWKRGYNQAELLAKAISLKSGTSFIKAIEKVIHTKAQADLDRRGRLKNIKNAFILALDINFKDKTIVIIDDVVTTGATLNESAKLLKSAGAKSVIGLVFAHSL